MDTALTTTIVSTSAPLITSVLGMFIMVNQVGKRIDNLQVNIRELRVALGDALLRRD